MERLGEVTKVDGEWLEITFCRPSDCEKCHACMGGPTETTLRLKGEASVGDKALVSLPDHVITKASALAYAVPLAGFLIGMFAGDKWIPLEHSLGAVIGAVVGLALPLAWLYATDKKRQKDPKWTPQIIRIIHMGEDT